MRSTSAFVSLAIILLAPLASAQDVRENRVVRPIDNRSVVRLAGTVHPRARAAADRGPVSPTMRLERMMLVFQPTPQQQSELDKLLAEQQAPSSANYHKWLTPEEFADRFGLTRQDVAVAAEWLRSQGFTVEETARGRNWLAFSGIAAQVEAAFHAPIHSFSVDGKLHFAAASDPSIPAALSGVVVGISALHDFAPRPLNVKPRPHVTSSITGNHFLAPGDFGTIYNLPSYSNGAVCASPCNDGSGQSIAIVGQSQLSTDNNSGRNASPGANGQQYDVVTFRNLAGLPPVNLQVRLFGTDPGVVTTDVDEANLDVEWTGGAAPNASLIFVIEKGSNGGAFTALVDAVNNNLAPVISVSYGVCEASLDSTTQSQLTQAGQQANSQGQAIVVATGDAGAADCDTTVPATHGLSLDFPAGMPYSTAVGGTEFSADSANSTDPTQPTQYWNGSSDDIKPSAFSYIPETAWNDTGTTGPLLASGGGASVKFPKPTWQSGAGVPADGQRDIPDLSFSASPAHDGYLICSQSSCVNNYRASDTTFDAIGGTSAGTPAFAGLLALINQRFGSSQGNINPQMYMIANNSATSWAFNDITTGNNIVPCTVGTGCVSGSVGYSAGTGYDLVTGLGSVDAAGLVDALLGTPNPNFYLVPGSRALSAAFNATATTQVTLFSREGFNARTSFSCSIASPLTGTVCSMSPANGVAPGQSSTLTVGPSNSGLLGTQTVAVTVTGVSGNLSESATISAAINYPDFTLTPNNSPEDVLIGGSTTDVFNLASTLGFSGIVSFSCAGTAGLTCSVTSNPVTADPGLGVTPTLSLAASSTATSGSITITGTSGPLTHALTIPVTVTNSDFVVTATSSSLTISRGGTGTDNIAASSVQVSSSVALTCSVSSSLGSTTCSLNPTTITTGSNPSTLTIRAAVLTSDLRAPSSFSHRGRGICATFVFALGIVFTLKPKGSLRRMRTWRSTLLGLLAVVVLLVAVSCGGGGNSSTSSAPSPTPLSGTVTVTGTNGVFTHSVSIAVTIQ